MLSRANFLKGDIGMLIKNFLSVLFATVLFTSCTQGYEEMDNAASLASAPGVAATLPLPSDVAAKMDNRILVRLVANVKTGNLAEAIEKKMDLVVPISRGGASSTTGQVNTELVFKSYTDSRGQAQAITAQDILTNIRLTVYQGASDGSATV